MAQSDRADLGKITAGSQKSGMLHSLFAAAAFGRRRLEMASACALAINKGRFVYTLRLLRPAELVGAKPLHLLAQTTLPLKSPTGAFIAALRSANAKLKIIFPLKMARA